MAFDARAAHTLVCLQSNTGVPETAQECVCTPRLPQYRPTFEVDGPHTRRAPRGRLFWLTVIVSAALLVACVAFTIGVIARLNGVF